MRIFIGLDGGGTGCRAQAELEDGRRTPVVTGGAANVFSNPDGAQREIAATLAQALAHAQALLPDGAATQTRIVLGLAGASESGAAQRLQHALPYPQVSVMGDIDISLKGAFQQDDGIVLAVGTGSVLARQRKGQMQRLGGYGFVLGDEGSGAWIGREALRLCLHARDGFGQDGPLLQAIWQQLGPLPQIIGFAGRARPADYAALAPLVLQHDRAQCPVAGNILDRGCAYLQRAISHLQAGDRDMPVAPTGGLGPVLLDRIMAQGGAYLHRAAPKGTALDGAIWQARHGARHKETSS
ncbi:BadF/BadG/BcrA/BcrD ATPase family protein [Roseinatronobacter alkalisoli]|uniref:BadF/BadG/BcrA/BcrD ATPase family protein n=1 Tax=Roseinatronobacter alkalisoli TaxID=3028235 RepID=A0ABT5TEL1_9RHOB|nr:BadF/BadG/BcrA/BcrD ATPase family protein [Roseinatronobacter sp. HJB301]MDD7973558.1 BadF/BadG/BcrA/BcrD ATPase family protein [Roseinatronobacter sp. HJB301]